MFFCRYTIAAICILLLHILWLFPATGFAAGNASPRVALIIGNSAYKDVPLKNPANDATDLASALRQLDFEVILKLNATQAEMKRSVAQFGKKLKNCDVGLFYYAGHGMQVKGKNYLIPIGGHIESELDVELESMDVYRVLGTMEKAGNDINIVILDACRNNPFARSFRSTRGGLAKMDAPTGSIIAYATAPGSVASDGEGRNGVYTQYLLKNLHIPNVPIEKVFKTVRVAVLKATEKKQIPWESSSLTGDFYFNRGKEIALPPKTDFPNKTTNTALPVASQKVVKKPLEMEKRHLGSTIFPQKVALAGKYIGMSTGGNKFHYLYNINTGTFENDKVSYYRFYGNKDIWKEYSLKLVNKPTNQGFLLYNLGEVLHTIPVPAEKYGRITNYTFTFFGNILVGTNQGYLILYNRDGKILFDNRFNELPVQSIAVQRDTAAVAYPDGNFFILKYMERKNNKRTIISLSP